MNDKFCAETLCALAQGGTRLIALRSAGFNHVDLSAAREWGLKVVRVPAYSPHAVAEHTVGLILALNRRLCRAYNRVREGNFALEGLLGFDLFGRTAGIVGAGKIGAGVARILHGFGCQILLHDSTPNAELESIGRFVPLAELLQACDILSLHCPLVAGTRHMINAQTLSQMKPGAMLVNTSRGGLVDTRAVIESLKQGHLGYLGLDVYEEEADLFFEDRSAKVIQDDVFSRLLTFPNVLITGHQAFFTENALAAIAETTLNSVTSFEQGAPLANEVVAPSSR